MPDRGRPLAIGIVLMLLAGLTLLPALLSNILVMSRIREEAHELPLREAAARALELAFPVRPRRVTPSGFTSPARRSACMKR